MKKKGLSHIEVILGFVIFMIAIFFLISSYEPLFKNKNNNQQLIQKLYDNFLENTSIHTREYYAFIENPTNDVVKINLDQDINDYGVVAIGASGEAKRVSIVDFNTGEICVGIGPTNDFITIRLVKSLNLDYYSDACLTNENRYKISTSLDSEKVSVEKIKVFDSIYQTNPESLRSSLDLPTSDFEYNFTGNDFSYVEKKTRVTSGENVYSTSRKINAINQTGSIVDLEILLRIW